MDYRRRRRMIFALVLLIAIGGAAGLVTFALKNSVTYFYGPSDVAMHRVGPGVAFRIGGLVLPESVKKKGADVRFFVTDGTNSVPVQYRGLPPALFAEGKGVVATGRLNGQGVFMADQLLAKHDERYMPPEVEKSLKKSGHWKENGQYGGKGP